MERDEYLVQNKTQTIGQTHNLLFKEAYLPQGNDGAGHQKGNERAACI
jgi:hypothetical protein